MRTLEQIPESSAEGTIRQSAGMTRIFYILLIGLAVFSSLRVVLTTFTVDADTMHTLMLWEGIRLHGVAWLASWKFTPDNWLLSLLPFHFALYEVFGPQPGIAIIFGWCILLASAGVSGLIAIQLGARRAALPIVATMLFANQFAHASGYVSYSTSHNITNLFGLACISLLCAWCRSQRTLLLALTCLLLTLGAISDPWMVAAFHLPIILGAILALISGRGIPRLAALSLSGMVALSIVAVRTRLFNVLDFLPSLQFVPGNLDSLKANSVFLIKDLGALLNIVPGATNPSFVFCVLSLGIFVIVVFLLARTACHAGILARPDRLGTAVVSLISMSGIAAAFVISDVPAQDFSARFILNILYLVVIGLLVLLDLSWSHASRALRLASALTIALLIASSGFSHRTSWSSSELGLRDSHVREILAFLEQNGLKYGYGPYWGASANAVTGLSRIGVRIRPAEFDNRSGALLIGGRVETSDHWYEIDDLPKDRTDTFVYVVSDGENCPDKDFCVRGVIKQFGEPDRSIQHGAATILVWDHSLLERPLRLGQPLRFDDAADPARGPGWARPEAWGTWTTGLKASIVVRLNDPAETKTDITMKVMGRAFVHPLHPVLHVAVFANGVKVGNLQYDLNASGSEQSVVIPRELAVQSNGLLSIQFRMINPTSPSQLRMSADQRLLGLGLTQLTLDTDAH